MQLYTRPGRPRAQTNHQRVEVVAAWGNALNAHAVLVRDQKRDRAIAKLQARSQALWVPGAFPQPNQLEFARVSAVMDRIGRVTRVPVKPPETAYPEIDKAIAAQFGITERMVRRCRTDPALKRFLPHPVWIEREWEAKERLSWLAKRHMTPERYAKREPLELIKAVLRVDAIDTFRVIPEPGQRHRVGCDESYHDSFSIGPVYRYPGRGDLVCEALKKRRLVRSSPHCWVSPAPARKLGLVVDGKETVPGRPEWRHCGTYGIIEIRRQPDPNVAARKQAAWKAKQKEQWKDDPAIGFAEDMPTVRVVTAQPWRHVWKKRAAPGWAGDPWEIVPAPWIGPSRKRFALGAVIQAPDLAPKRRWTRIEAAALTRTFSARLFADCLSEMITALGVLDRIDAGRIDRRRTFEHVLDDTIVLGPHQTWRWMSAQEFCAAFPRDRELYDWLRQYRQALEAHPHRPRGYWAKVKNKPLGVWSTPHVEEIVPERPRKTNSARTAYLPANSDDVTGARRERGGRTDRRPDPCPGVPKHDEVARGFSFVQELAGAGRGSTGKGRQRPT